MPLYPAPKKAKGQPFRVVIITTSASGGNHAVPKALHAFLSTQDNIEPIIIDAETVALEHCPIMLATGTHTYDMIYSRMFQQTDDFTEILDRETMNREIHKYIPSAVNREFKKLIVSMQPDLIISTRSYAPEDFGLATTGIAFRMIHDNFEVALFLNPFYGRMPSEYMRSWVPSFEPSIFKALFEWHTCIDLYDENDDYETLMQKIASCLYVPVDDVKKQFEHFGYAANTEFSQLKDSGQIAALRAKWGLKEDETAILISMGKYGSGAMTDVLLELMQACSVKRQKYFFVCGNSPSLKKELVELAEGDDRFIICGLLSSAEMNELMNISSLAIGKAGSGSCGETLVTYCPLLTMRYYPWEAANANYLIKMGLATNYDSKKPLLDQIEACLAKPRPIKQAPHIFEGWQERLMEFISQVASERRP